MRKKLSWKLNQNNLRVVKSYFWYCKNHMKSIKSKIKDKEVSFRINVLKKMLYWNNKFKLLVPAFLFL